MSSSRPTNGEMNVAPAREASRAWFIEKTSVTLVLISRSDRPRTAFRPSTAIGILMVTLDWSSFAQSSPSLTIPAASVRHGLDRDRAVDRGQDVLDALLERPAGLADERRVGGDAVEDAPTGDFADFLDVSRVNEDLQVRLPLDRATGDCSRTG